MSMSRKPIVYQIKHQDTGHFATGRLFASASSSASAFDKERGRLWFTEQAAKRFAARLRYVTRTVGLEKPPLRVVEYQLIEVD